MKKREFVVPAFNAMTGFGNGVGMRKEFGGGVDGNGWFSFDVVGCIDAPRRIVAGSVYASDFVGSADMFLSSVGRDSL